MAFLFADSLRNLSPFSMLQSDVRESKELVHRLTVPESTKNFVFAIRVPEHDSTIYILSAHNLSQRSAIDAECLIREIRPDAVVAQVNYSAFGESQVEESTVLGDGSIDSIPTSAFKVVKQLLVGSVNKEKYESVAGALVLKEVFGTGFNGHVVAAKKVAGEVGSSFMELESPFVMQGLAFKCLIPYGSAFSSSSGTFQITNDAQAQMLKLLSSHITQLGKDLTPSSCVPNEMQLDSDEVPPFAHSVYSMLVDLHNIFNDLPAIREALTNARKMLSEVNRGESIDAEVISEVYLFQVAVEGLRIVLNNSGRLPIRNLASLCRGQVQFSKLSSEDKSYALMADHLRRQAKKFKKIVAVVDASNLAGLRRHWKTFIPQDVRDMSEDFDKDENSNESKLKRMLFNKPVVAFGGGGPGGAGALSLSKAISASPFLRVLSPSKPTSLVKASLSPEVMELVRQSIILSAIMTSFSVMRASFYKMMRRTRAKPIGALPLAMFGASLATCAGLLFFEEEVERVALSLASAPSIAKLGRGIRNLHEASLGVTRRENNRIHNAIETLRQRLKNSTLQ